MRLLVAIILLAGCVSSSPTMPAPGAWHEAALPLGVLAEADIERQEIAWDRRLLDHPPIVVAAVILHEWCHLRGAYTEGEADCCAAGLLESLYGSGARAEVAVYWMTWRRGAVAAWLGECQ